MPKSKPTDQLPFDVYVCARHDKPRKDANLVGFYLCDDCSASFEDGAFHGSPPVHTGSCFVGFCSLCNQHLDSIRLRQWYLCGVCERVARSMGRGLVAARYVEEWWSTNVLPKLPNLVLNQTDPPVLRATGASTTASPKVCRPDFTAVDVAQSANMLTIELKSGRSPITGMSQFQLDTTDCDDILTVVKEELIPGYVIHAHIVAQYEPPTSRFVAVGLWWSDIFRMAEAFQSVRRRQVEQRYAAYFKRTCFQTMPSFLDEIETGRYQELTEKLRREGVPTMYLV